jgi:acyl-CoA synthetase (AMP-forming)/AMP-acid ligase II
MAAGADPDRVVITDTDGTSMTSSELQDAARAAAAKFQQAGATQVGFLATNSRALPVSLFGAAIAGIPFVPLNYRLSDDQLSDQLHREPGMVVVAAPEMVERLNRLGIDAVIGVAEVLSSRDAGEPDPVEIDSDDIAVLLYTSGTTATPKAAVLRHRHLAAYVIGTVEFGGSDPDEAVLVSVPPYHVAGVSTILTNLYGGRRIVYLDPFEPGTWLDLVKNEGVTHAMVVPTMMSRIIDKVDGPVADVPTLRSLAYGGAKMPLPVIEQALIQFPNVAFTNAYGLTETSSTIALLGPDDHRAAVASEEPAIRGRLASTGRAVPGVEIAVMDDQGEPVESGVVGDVLVRGDQVSGEYVGGAGVDPSGWFATRDRGWLDTDGYLFIEGRSDDVIIRGGENIAPAEIEDVLVRHPSVKECAVVGVPDTEWGQRIGAVVVLSPDADTSVEDLREWCRAHLRSSKTPDLIEIRDELPYTETGKLLRRVVRSSFEATST